MAFYDSDVSPLIDLPKLNARIAELGAQITRDYQGKELTLVSVLKGASFFTTDLARAIDLPIAGLLKDLKQRGLLEETLVVWGTEFGRTPHSEGASGRNHHPYGFSAWLAGGGIKGGIAHGATDALGFHAVENRHYVTDIHATVLHQLGLDPRRLEVPGRKRLERDFGSPIRAIIA